MKPLPSPKCRHRPQLHGVGVHSWASFTPRKNSAEAPRVFNKFQLPQSKFCGGCLSAIRVDGLS